MKGWPGHRKVFCDGTVGRAGDALCGYWRRSRRTVMASTAGPAGSGSLRVVAMSRWWVWRVHSGTRSSWCLSRAGSRPYTANEDPLVAQVAVPNRTQRSIARISLVRDPEPSPVPSPSDPASSAWLIVAGCWVSHNTGNRRNNKVAVGPRTGAQHSSTYGSSSPNPNRPTPGSGCSASAIVRIFWCSIPH